MILNDIYAKKTLLLLRQWKSIFKIILFDIFYVLTLFSAATLFDLIFANYETALVGTIKGYLLFFVYFMIVVLSYSFFKYCFFDVFCELIGKEKKIGFAAFNLFFWHNLLFFFIVFSLFFGLYLFFSVALIDFLKKTAVPIFLLLFTFCSYLFLQASHAVFAKKMGGTIFEIIKETKDVLVSKWFMPLGKWFLWNLIFSVLGFIVYLLFLLFTSLNVTLFIFFVLFAYFLVLWNRMYLFLLFQHNLSVNQMLA